MHRLHKNDPLRAAIRQEFCDRYATTSNAVLMERFGVTRGTIQRWAREFGLKKDSLYRREVQRQNATGRVLSQADREKLRQRALGRKMSNETKKKILQTKIQNGTILRGPRHPFWKGGRPWERFKNPEYLAWRHAVLERDAYVCQHCGRQCKKRERGLAAHHIKPYAEYPELRYDVSNGMTLCRQCHMTLHGKPPAIQERIPCACGCGTLIDTVDPYGRPRRYVNYHGAKGRSMADSTKQLLRDQRKGMRDSTKRIGRPPRSSK